MSFENFPYTNFHELNLDWIAKIAKDFLDQYTHIQEIIEQGITDIGEKTDTGLADLQNKYDTLNGLLQDWYDTHSADIANQLADALEDLNTWYTEHQGYLDQYLTDSINTFNASADAKAAQTLESIPDDYTALSNHVLSLQDYMDEVINQNLMGSDPYILYPVYIPAGTPITASTADHANFPNQSNLRIYWYDIDGNPADWFGLYPSDGNYKTRTLSSDVYWLSWATGVAPSVNIMVNIGGTPLTYVPYYMPPHRFCYKGWINGTGTNDLNNYIKSGWYYLNNATEILNYPTSIKTNYAQLRVYNKGISNDTIIQEIIGSDGSHAFRTLTQDGSTTTDWQLTANAIDIVDNMKIQLEKVVSLNGNYAIFDKLTWRDGVYNSQDGTVVGTAPYKYAYIPLEGPGTYIKTGLKATFGTNFTYFALLDANKNFITSILGDNDETSDPEDKYTCKVTLTEDILKTAKYTVLHFYETAPYIPKLFYNSPAHITDREIPIEYGFTTDQLYKKTLICDGDSICEAIADYPLNFNGYYGRTAIKYQMSGHNYGVSGGTITDMTDTTVGGNPRHSVVVNIDTIHSEHPTLDYLILEGGTNDADLIGRFVNDQPPERFGTWTETDFSGSYDNTTFCGAVDELFYKVNMYYPHAKVGFIIAMEMGTNANTVINRKRYFDEIVKIANKWHIPILNLWKDCPADARLTSYYNPSLSNAENVTAGSFYYDGQHPTSSGYDKMQNMIEKWIHNL